MNKVRGRSLAPYVGAAAGAILMMSLAYLLKAPCLDKEWDKRAEWRTLCYTDVQAMYMYRGPQDGKVLYLDGNGLQDGADGDLEYPVGSGYIMMFSAAMSSNVDGFFATNVLVLTASALVMAILAVALSRNRWRALLFSLGPPLIFYGFHNWDLVGGLFIMGALFAWTRSKPNVAAGLLGMGVATKVFPGVVLPGLLLLEARRSGRLPWKMVASAAATFVALNLPILFANPKAWWFVWKFQSSRLPNRESMWTIPSRYLRDLASEDFWVNVYPRLTSVLSGLLFLVAMAWFLKRCSKRETLDVSVVSMGLMIIWLMTAKVYSPQFALWLLPFFALVKLPIKNYIMFLATDVACLLAIAYFFVGPRGPGEEPRLLLVAVAAFIRFVVLGWTLWSLSKVTPISPKKPLVAAEYGSSASPLVALAGLAK